jgi:hypothetical protein
MQEEAGMKAGATWKKEERKRRRPIGKVGVWSVSARRATGRANGARPALQEKEGGVKPPL